MGTKGKVPSSDTTSQLTNLTVPDSDPDEVIRKFLLNLNDYSHDELSHFEEIVKKNEDLQRVEEDRIMRLQADYDLISNHGEDLMIITEGCFICNQRFVPLIRPGVLCRQCAREACSQHIVKIHKGEVSICTRCQQNNEFTSKTGLWFKELQLRFCKEEMKAPSVILKLSLSAHKEQIRHVEQVEARRMLQAQMDSLESAQKTTRRKTTSANNQPQKTSKSGSTGSPTVSLKDLLKKRSKSGSGSKVPPLSKSLSTATIITEPIPEDAELPPLPTVERQPRLPPGSTQSAPPIRPYYSSLQNIPQEGDDKAASLMLPSRQDLSFTKSSTSQGSKSSKKSSSLLRKAVSLLSISNHDTESIPELSDYDDASTTIPSEVGSLRDMKLQKRKESKSTAYSVASHEEYDPTLMVKGEVSLGLDYDFQRNRFLIYVKECRNLFAIGNDKNNTNPYVKTYLLPDKSKSSKRTTNFKSSTTDPVYHEALVYDVRYPDLQQRSLEVSVWHHQALSNNLFLGEFYICLDNWNFDDITPRWYQLHEKKHVPVPLPLLLYRGDLVLSVKHELGAMNDPLMTTDDVPGTLYVWIKEAKNIFINSSRKPDTFLKLYLLPDRSCKKKTPVIKNTTNPRWNMMFRYYDISVKTLRESSLEVTLWDRGHFRMYRQLGGIRLNVGRKPNEIGGPEWMDATGHEIVLWERMINKPNVWIEGVITLRDASQFAQQSMK